MHWLEIQIVSGLHRKKSLKRYLAQYGHVKIMPDCLVAAEEVPGCLVAAEEVPGCLVAAEEVPGCLCYSFQHFISERAATGKMTHEYTINQRSGIIGLKIEHMLLPKRYSLLNKSKLLRNKMIF